SHHPGLGRPEARRPPRPPRRHRRAPRRPSRIPRQDLAPWLLTPAPQATSPPYLAPPSRLPWLLLCMLMREPPVVRPDPKDRGRKRLCGTSGALSPPASPPKPGSSPYSDPLLSPHQKGWGEERFRIRGRSGLWGG